MFLTGRLSLCVVTFQSIVSLALEMERRGPLKKQNCFPAHLCFNICMYRNYSSHGVSLTTTSGIEKSHSLGLPPYIKLPVSNASSNERASSLNVIFLGPIRPDPARISLLPKL
ncbi:hypothetical protein BGZ57DRAFT_19075 [Hyaloscypha finlandica]|nr:hypothetical protein BGZ57DRAFT_19075 [Hyaloscypha finlandica]